MTNFLFVDIQLLKQKQNQLLLKKINEHTNYIVVILSDDPIEIVDVYKIGVMLLVLNVIPNTVDAIIQFLNKYEQTYIDVFSTEESTCVNWDNFIPTKYQLHPYHHAQILIASDHDLPPWLSKNRL